MKLRKFTGKNTRDVLRLIREELGGDAMIVSSRQTATGVEMIAMSSADAQSVIDDGAAPRAEPPSHAPAPSAHPHGGATSAPHPMPGTSHRPAAREHEQAGADRYARDPRLPAHQDDTAQPLPGRRVPAAEQLIRSTNQRAAPRREPERLQDRLPDPAVSARAMQAAQAQSVQGRRAIDTEIERTAAAGRLYDRALGDSQAIDDAVERNNAYLAAEDAARARRASAELQGGMTHEQTERSFLDYALSISPQARDLAERAMPSQAADEFQRAMQAMPKTGGSAPGSAAAPRHAAPDPRQPDPRMMDPRHIDQPRQPAMPTLTQAMDRGSSVPRFPSAPGHPTGMPTMAAATSAPSGMAQGRADTMHPVHAAHGALPPSVPAASTQPMQPAVPHAAQQTHPANHIRSSAPVADPMMSASMAPGAELESSYASGAMPAYSPVWAMAPAAPPATVSIPAPPLMGPAVGPHAGSLPPSLAASMAPFVQVPLQMVAGGIPMQPAMQPAPSGHPMLPEHDEADGKLAEAFRSMRDFLAQQWAGFAWRDATLRHPAKALLWRDLTDTGFSPALARLLADRLPDNIPDAKVRDWLQDVIARNVSCAAREDELVEMGGAYALVGPTGVGKTTTAAKIAARCVVRHGTESLGLISTDGYRIGAQDQLRTYGRILGVPVYTAQNADDLRAVLATMSRKRLVLVDAMGVGQRDTRVAEQTAMFDAVKLRRLLVLSASSQPEALEEVVSAYTGTPPGSMASAAPADMRPLAGVVLSKLDESVKIGCALDAVMRHKLRIQYVATGQRVPEDLHLGNASVLAHKALRPRGTPAFKLSEAEYDLVFMPPPVSAADSVGRRGF